MCAQSNASNAGFIIVASMEGMNTKATMYSLPVDSDHKATELRLFSIAPPHMRAFHLAWLSLFSNFFSTFSIPPLIAIIRHDLNLSDTDIGHAGIASFAGSILSRLAMGPVCDLVGPRYASSVLSLLTAPIVFATSLASSANNFIILRFLIGFSLANFVSNQFWMSSMFSNNVVGLANGFAAGWANVGSGVTQLVMPLIYSFIITMGATSSMAWRLAFVVPSVFQTVTAIMVLLYGQDLPDGDYKKVCRSSAIRPKESFFKILFHGLSNYRGWILGLAYGYCFGVELVIDNIIAQYFYDRFHLDVQIAGAIAASFSLANCVSRPFGGVISDAMSKRFGMRGRLWSLWVVQSVAGLLCILLGRVNSLYGSIFVMCTFSLFVQAASGLTFGVVPFVSKRSLGVISGMTGSGGTVGAVVTQLLFFSGSTFSKATVVGNVRGGPDHAMKAAIRVTLTKTIQGKAVIQKLRATAARSEKGNLGVCKDNYDSAVNDLQSALVCLRNKDKAGLKNQLSAVVTYFETCDDAYTEEPGEINPLGDVSGVVQQLASNNLAIADHLNF